MCVPIYNIIGRRADLGASSETLQEWIDIKIALKIESEIMDSLIPDQSLLPSNESSEYASDPPESEPSDSSRDGK